MRLVVAVPCFNAGAPLAEALESVGRQSRSADRLLLIDDRSSDDSVAIATRAGWEVHLQPPNRTGLAAARNLALELVDDGDLLAGLDADAVMEPDYLAVAATVMSAWPGLAAIGGRLDERWRDSLADRWRGFHMAQQRGDRAIDDPPFLFGATMTVRAGAARAVGGWDERFRTNHEDVDFCRRLRLAGMPFRYEPGCRAWHLKRDTPASALHGFWNWFRPAGELAGHFDSLDRWRRDRFEAVNLGIARHRLLRDVASGHPELTALTLPLAPALTLLDRRRLGAEADSPAIQEAIAFGRRLTELVGWGEPAQRWVCDLLEELAVRPLRIDSFVRGHTEGHDPVEAPEQDPLNWNPLLEAFANLPAGWSAAAESALLAELGSRPTRQGSGTGPAADC
jgi:GT2 family glycosyltransferase